MVEVHIREADTNQGKFPKSTVATELLQKQRSLVRTDLLSVPRILFPCSHRKQEQKQQ